MEINQNTLRDYFANDLGEDGRPVVADKPDAKSFYIWTSHNPNVQIMWGIGEPQEVWIWQWRPEFGEYPFNVTEPHGLEQVASKARELMGQAKTTA